MAVNITNPAKSPESQSVRVFAVKVSGEILVPIRSRSGKDIMEALNAATAARERVVEALGDFGSVDVGEPEECRRKRELVTGGDAAGDGAAQNTE